MGNALNIPLHRRLEGKNAKYSRFVAKFVFHAMKRRRQFIDISTWTGVQEMNQFSLKFDPCMHQRCYKVTHCMYIV